jgi:hypothetical protein
MIYELNVTEAMNVTMTLNPYTTTYAGFAIGYSCPPMDNCIAAAYGSAATPKVIGAWPDCLHLEPGTYYIMVDTWSSPDCIPNYDLTIAACVEPIGRCCYLPYPNCVDTTQADCNATYAGTWTNGANCAANPCPDPTGNTCADPRVIAIPAQVPYSQVDSTCTRVNDYSATCLGSYDGGEDMIFRIDVTADGTYTFTATGLTSSDNWIGMAIDPACPLNATTCLNKATSSGTTVTFTQALTVGSYYLMIDTYPAPNCINFTLSIQ